MPTSSLKYREWKKFNFVGAFNYPLAMVNGNSVRVDVLRGPKDNGSRCGKPRRLISVFDMDGNLEVAVLPWYALHIYDARTGQLKDTCQFTKGRSYGFFGVYDFDGDGNKEFLVMADFSKHVDVLGYREGKLQLFWKHEIELDISNPKKILRVISKPASDIDGDGGMEVVLNLYNDTGDGQWHLIVRDGMTGRVKADLVNEFAQDALDLDGD